MTLFFLDWSFVTFVLAHIGSPQTSSSLPFKASFDLVNLFFFNGKMIVFNLHKFEPPQIMQPSFTFLTALLHTLHLLYLSSKLYLHSLMPIPLLFKKKKPSQLLPETTI